MKKTNVCFVSLATYPLFNPSTKQGFGGSEVQLYQIGTRLSSFNEFKISFIVGDYGQKAIEHYGKVTVYRSVDKFSTKPQKEKFLEKIKRKTRKWYHRFSFFYTLALNRPDILVLRSASSGVGKFRLWTKFFRTKLVYMAAHEADCSGEYEKKNGTHGKWYKYGLTRADLVIAQNEEQKELLKKNYGINAMRLNSVYDVPDINKKIGAYLLWVGRCEDWKRPELFIKLAREIKTEKFMMIAPPALHKEKYWEKIKGECAKVKNIEFKSLVPFDRVDKYFRNAKLFVITSKYEGFPNTLIQAAKNKTPIISLSINPNNLFDNYNLGYYANNDFRKLILETKRILASKQELNMKGNEAFRYARLNHDISKLIHEYRKILVELAK